jgi:hypothetical protein
MELGTDAHTLKFWVDGKPFCPGFTNWVIGLLCWALSINLVAITRHQVQIVPSAEVPLEEHQKFGKGRQQQEYKMMINCGLFQILKLHILLFCYFYCGLAVLDKEKGRTR